MQQWRLHFEFRDYQGRVHRNTIDLPADEAEQWKGWRQRQGAVRLEAAD